MSESKLAGDSIFDDPAESPPDCIDWARASRRVAGNADMDPSQPGDDEFLIEMLAMFYNETLPKLVGVAKAAKAWRDDGAITGPSHPDGAEKYVEEIVREGAHAVKGTAANLILQPLSTAAAEFELALKTFSERTHKARVDVTNAEKAGSTNPDAESVLKDQASQRDGVLSELLRGDRRLLKAVFREFRRLAVFIETDVLDKAKALGSEDIPMDEVEAVTEAGLREALAGLDI